MAQPAKIRTPFGQRLKLARMGALPFFIWVAGVFGAMQLWLAESIDATYVGLARVPETHVNSAVDGKLERVLVDLYQTVAVGDPLATFDDTGLDARLEVARAEFARLAAEVEAQRATIAAEEAELQREAASRHRLAMSTSGLEYPAELRAFHADEARIELAILQTRLELTTSELETDRLDVALRRAEALFADAIVAPAEVEDLTLRRTLELARTEKLRLIEAGNEAALEEARDRRNELLAGYEGPQPEAFGKSAIEQRLAGVKAALQVQAERIDELAQLREAYLIRAPASGRVAALTATEGQFVLAGDPLLVLMRARTDEVTLWIPELASASPSIGDRLVVARATDTSLRVQAECIVKSMSPRLELMPQRLWRDVRIAEYGRACLLGPATALQLVPGERVHIDPLDESSP